MSFPSVAVAIDPSECGVVGSFSEARSLLAKVGPGCSGLELVCSLGASVSSPASVVT